MAKRRDRGATATACVLLAALAVGCRGNGEGLRLAAVEKALHAAGLNDLQVVTAASELAPPLQGAPAVALNVAGQPDWLQDRKERLLLVVRIPKIAEAERVVPDSRTERRGGIAVRASRVCNVLIFNYLSHGSSYAALETRIKRELRLRCG
jgi:hypothetical protein